MTCAGCDGELQLEATNGDIRLYRCADCGTPYGG